MTAVRTPPPASTSRFTKPAALATLLAAALLALPATAPAATKRVKPSALPAFPSCTSLLHYARRNARQTGGRTGVPTRAGVVMPQVLSGPVQTDAALPTGAPTAAAPAPSAAEAKDSAPDFSATNVQEAGVDEPDIVKTDGRTVYAIADGRLRALDVTGAAPRLVGTLALDGSFGHQLLIRGKRLLVMSNAYGGGPFAADVIASASQVTLSEVDISDPAAMRILRTMTIEGALVDARLTGGTARVVSAPRRTTSGPPRSAAPRWPTSSRGRSSGATSPGGRSAARSSPATTSATRAGSPAWTC